MAGKDPVFFPWVQKWIVPAGLQDVVLESRIKQNTVYFTLGNANYASMYFAGLLPVFGLSAVKNKGTKRIAFGILSVAMFICLIFTYSRVGIVMLFVVLLSGAWMCRKIWTKYWKKCLICLAGAVIVFVVSDGMTGFRFGERILLTVQSFTEKRTNCDLEELYTKQDGIYFTLHGVSVKMYARYGLGEADTLQLVQNDGKNISDSYNENTGEIAVPGLEEVSIFTEELDGESVLFFCLGETVFRFVKDTDNGYLYYTGNGKYDTIEPVQQFGFRGMEHMASGRFYIWSRTLPMLKKYGLFGCGEDNFYLHYPQNDYLGKAQYCSNPLTVIEKPHNTYLLIAVQNGIPALLFLLLLYCLYFKESLKLYSGKSCYDSRQWTGLIIFLFSIGYMAGYLFVDSSVNISPLFWVLLGMGKRCNEELFEKGN